MPEDVARHPLDELKPTARQILIAARDVLRERGMDGLTIEAVANEANVSRTQVPYHFGSRAGLVEALFDWLFFDVWARFMKPADAPWPMTVHEALEWTRQELDDPVVVRDSMDLVVHSLRDQMVRQRLGLLYERDRAVEVEVLGLEFGAGEAGARRKAAVGAVLLAIDEGLAMQCAVDPDFDVDAALEAAEAILTGGLPPRSEATVASPSVPRKE